ncbi:MAG: nucleotidyltransferase family protein [Bacillota bacterium]
MTAVLAAGASRRMGTSKMLLPFGETTLLEYTVAGCMKHAPGIVAVILAGGDSVCRENLERVFSREIRDGLLRLVENPGSGCGQSTSIKAAVDAFPEAEAWIFVLGDMPFSPPLIDGLLREYERGTECVAYSHSGAPGCPALFSGKYLSALRELKGDGGARGLLSSSVILFAPKERLLDIDDEKDYVLARNQIGHF